MPPLAQPLYQRFSDGRSCAEATVRRGAVVPSSHGASLSYVTSSCEALTTSLGSATSEQQQRWHQQCAQQRQSHEIERRLAQQETLMRPGVGEVGGRLHGGAEDERAGDVERDEEDERQADEA